MGRRRHARELALQFLYGFDLNRKDLGEAIAEFWERHRVTPEVQLFARELIRGTVEHLPYLDEVIEKHAQNWRLKRIALVDKNVLRLGLYELCFRDDIPPLVAINEAVDIAKKFSTEQSGRFVNGILDQVHQELQKQSAEGERGGRANQG